MWDKLNPICVDQIREESKTAKLLDDKFEFDNHIKFEVVLTEGTRPAHACPSICIATKFHGYMRKIYLANNHMHIYEGECYEGTMTGWGRLITTETIYVGQFIQGMRSGDGTLYNRDGVVLKHGLWYHD